jgi:hypothetical protein
MDCSVTGFVDEFLNFFNILSFFWCLVTLNIRQLQLRLDWPQYVNAIQKPLSSLKNVFQKPLETFEGFW